MKHIIIITAAGSLLLSCSIKAPEVRVTGEKTALEQEVLGTYERLEEDTWMVASSRSARKGDAGALSDEKSNVLDAIRRQKFNKDDIDEFKRNGWAGEALNGLLQIRENDLSKNDSLQVQLVTDIVAEENADRSVIMNRVIELKTSLQEASREEVMRIFSRMYQGNSEKGVWIQAEDGSWSRKK